MEISEESGDVHHMAEDSPIGGDVAVQIMGMITSSESSFKMIFADYISFKDDDVN